MSKSRQASKAEQEPAKDRRRQAAAGWPIVLYIGEPPWKAPTSLADMAEEVPAGLARYPTIPRML